MNQNLKEVEESSKWVFGGKICLAQGHTGAEAPGLGSIPIMSEKQQGDECGLREENQGKSSEKGVWREARLSEPGGHWKGFTLECHQGSLHGPEKSTNLI